MAGLSDDDLVRRAKKGDEGAWRELYFAHAGRLTVWLSSLPTGDAASDGDDIAAAAWLTAADKIGGFTGTSSDFAGWLFGIARNIAVNTRRRSGRRSTYPRATSDGGELWGVAEDPTPAVDAAAWARQLLGRLPPREAEVLACIDIAGLDATATASVLGISTAAVRTGHYRGIRRLRALLSDNQQPIPAVSRRRPPIIRSDYLL
ncbi:MAG TPA: RNA polymerase sigma factor [Nocardioidaceae bacterium]|nr:RNA polymerase sigma factor [Nocardioidaceae bacterium]